MDGGVGFGVEDAVAQGSIEPCLPHLFSVEARDEKPLAFLNSLPWKESGRRHLPVC